jgi:hypothetical protein
MEQMQLYLKLTLAAASSKTPALTVKGMKDALIHKKGVPGATY